MLHSSTTRSTSDTSAPGGAGAPPADPRGPRERDPGLLSAYADVGAAALTPREHQRLAEALVLAAAHLRPPAALDLYPEMTTADALGIGRSLVKRRIAAGERLVGAKAVQLDGRADGAIGAAWLTNAMLVEESLAVPTPDATVTLRPALAFVLGLVPAAATELDERAFMATATAVMPCVEVVADRGFGDATTACRVTADAAVDLIVVARGNARPPSGAEVRAMELTGGSDGDHAAGVVGCGRALALVNELLRGGATLPRGFVVVAPCGGARPYAEACDVAFGALGAVRVRTTSASLA